MAVGGGSTIDPIRVDDIVGINNRRIGGTTGESIHRTRLPHGHTQRISEMDPCRIGVVRKVVGHVVCVVRPIGRIGRGVGIERRFDDVPWHLPFLFGTQCDVVRFIAR